MIDKPHGVDAATGCAEAHGHHEGGIGCSSFLMLAEIRRVERGVDRWNR